MTFSLAFDAARADESCASLLGGARLLVELNPKLHTLASVEARAARQSRRDQKTLTKPVDKVSAWLAALEQTQRRLLDHPESLHHAKAFFYRQYVIKPEDVPESYFITQARILRNEGYGDIEITPKMRASILSLLVQDQARSLEPWLNYLLGSAADAENYPIWMKYWILNNVVKLSIYDPNRRAFGVRNRQTVAPFPELNPEALAQVKEMIFTRLDSEALKKVEDKDIAKLIRTANFGQIYGHEINKLSQYGARPFLSNEGLWVRYLRGSDHLALVNSLVGQNTGWCTTGRAIAESQLAGGDFHVYYTRDERGGFTRPRLAIRMLGNHIAEIRGVGHDQEFDPLISQSSVLEDKLKEFGHEADQYLNRSVDMKRLTEIDQRVANQGSLTIEDLRFLREVDRNIQGFGFSKDPRIEQLLRGRDLMSDIGLIFNVPVSKVASTRNELKSGQKSVFVGDLELSSPDLLPSEALVGDLNVSGCSSRSLRIPPIKVTGKLSVSGCQALNRLDIEADVRSVRLYYTEPIGKLQLSPSVEDLELGIKSIGDLRGTLQLKHLEIEGLESAGHLELPATQEHWRLDELKSVQTLVVAPGVKSLYLPELKSANSIVLPAGLEVLRLSKLNDISAIHSLPSELTELILGGAISAKGLDLPNSLERVWFDHLIDAKELPSLPPTLKSLELDNLQEADQLLLPESLETLWFPKLRSAHNLRKPARFDQMIYRGPTDFKN